MNDRTAVIGAPALLWVALALGLLAGLGEVAARTFQLVVLGRRIWLSEHYVWMAPVALVVIFAAAALLMIVVARLLRRELPANLALAVLIFLAIAGPMLSYARLHRLAMLLVAVGISIQGGRMLSTRMLQWLPRATRVAFAAAGIVALLAVLVFTRHAMFERRGLALLPPAPRDGPNVLLIILDTVRAASMSLYGYTHPTTPNLERLAAGGAVFQHAFSTSPWTLPAHGSIFTGRFAHELSADLIRPLNGTFPTLAEHFRDRGYMTAGFAANLLYTTREVGLHRGFIRYDDYPISAGMIANSSMLARLLASRVLRAAGNDQKLARRSAESMTDHFLDWVREPRERPFFAFINFFDAHAPYLPPDSLDGRFGPRRSGPALHDLSNREHWSEDEVTAERAAYDAVLLGLDQQLGRLFETLRADGLLENTVVIVTSDHGEQFGEHGLMDHGNSLYRPLLEVPLILHYPARVPAGLRIDTPVSLRDIAVTLAELAGQEPSPFPGTSLTAFWSDLGVPPSPILSEVRQGIRTAPWLPLARGGMKSLVADGHHYIENGDGAEELYALEDVEQLDNLRDRSAGVLARMRNAVALLVRVNGFIEE